MKKLKFFGKLAYLLNSIGAFLLVVAFILPYLPPSSFPTLSLLSLAVSPLILINLLFMAYWLIRFKKQFLVSGIVLVIAYFHFNPFFEFSSEGDANEYDHTLSVVSFNVRLFNVYQKNPETEKVNARISEILKTENPDVLCFQEYYKDADLNLVDYPYRFIHFKGERNSLGLAIFSKHPLINKNGFDFDGSFNNTIYADAVVGSDTLRIYNLHLQSLGVLPSVDFLKDSDTENLKTRMSERFVQQEKQVKKILAHRKTSKYPVVMAGDFNNTPFSYIYRKLKQDMNDAFLERGNGLGTTYSFDSYPMRIDYILSTEKFEVIRFRTLDETFSDHYPISAKLGWNNGSTK